jgi:hypothetical protein
MVAVAAMDIGKEFVQILGLPKETSFLQLTLAPNAPVEVTCRCFPDREQLAEVLALLQRYHLVRVEEVPLTAEAQATHAQTLQALDRLARIEQDLRVVLNTTPPRTEVSDALRQLVDSRLFQRVLEASGSPQASTQRQRSDA